MALQNIEANITLDLYNHDTTPTTIKAIQLDSETRYVAARLQNMGTQYDVDSGATVQLTVIRPDKVGVQISGTTFTYGDEGAQFLGPYAELTLVALAVSGKLLGQFKITSGTQILRTEIFMISAGVALDASTDEWAGEYDGYNLDELVEKVDAAVDKVDGMEADVTELKSGLDNFKVDNHFNLTGWRSGHIYRTSSPIGTIGSSTTSVVSGYDGAYATIKGDGVTYKIVLASGWELKAVGKYSSRNIGSFVEFVDTTGGYISLSTSYYYIFQLHKLDNSAISPSDVSANTIVLTHTEYTDKSLSLANKAADAKAVGDLTKEYHSYNWCDPAVITEHSGKYMSVSGSVGTDANYSYTDFIPVNPGDVVYILRDSQIKSAARYRYITAYNSSKEVISASGESATGRTYTVPSGVSYVIVSIFLADYNLGNYSINVGKMMPYDAFAVEKMPKGYKQASDADTFVTKMPLSSMPEYIRNAMAYRPLQSPSKGYMCLVSDDGKEGLATYTCPMVIAKNVPCTFAVMSESEVFADNNLKATVLDAVENHGCVIAQHGGRNWTEYSEYGLDQFFDEEKAFFDTLGVDVKSAVIPSHYTTPIVQIVAGGRFGVVRSGLKGYDAEGNYGDTVHNYYDFYTSGEGSNLYGLSSYNISGYTLDTNKLAINYAYKNNKILIVYWHEISLDSAKKAVIEGAIDYAKTVGLEFITLDKIPYLTETLSQI